MTTPTRPKLISQRLWQTRRAHYVAVFKKALLLLREKAPLPADEPNLNRELKFVVVTARLELDPNGRFRAPGFEQQNLADPDASTIQPHEYKRPDAQWVDDDPAAPDDRHREKSFTIECKRLGFPPSPGWKLNEQYVIDGIERFRSTTHRYGMHTAEGLMIGYVQSMGLAAVHSEVCHHAAAKGIPGVVLSPTGWQQEGVSELEHAFQRSFLLSPFHLTHLWLDMQDVPSLSRTAPARKPSKKSVQRSRKNARPSQKRSVAGNG